MDVPPPAQRPQRTQLLPEEAQGLILLQRDVLEKIARGHPPDECLPLLCRLVEQQVPHSMCTIMQPRDGRLSMTHAGSLDGAGCARFPVLEPGPQAASCGTAYFTQEPAIVADVLSDPRWQNFGALAIKYGIAACWSIPLRNPAGGLFGTFAISRTVAGPPSPAQLELIETSANLATLTFERAQAMRELLDQRDLLRNVVETIEDPIFVKDTESRYIAANAAECYGLAVTERQIAGCTDFDLYSEATAAQNVATDREVLERGERLVYEQDFENATYGRRTFQVQKQPLVSEDGTPFGVLGIARDLTELRRTERAMQESQKLESLGVLVGGIAHDVNNMLTGVLGNTELALEELASSSPARESMELVREGALRLADLTRQMLAFAGQGDVERSGVHLPTLIRNVQALIASSISKKASLSFEFEPDLPCIEADASQMGQVVMNLITNASEALGAHSGMIRIAVRRLGGAVEFEVQDSGQGMTPAVRERMFEPFFTTKFTGRGLGLAAVAGIVRSHGGQIEVESRPGDGTTTRVRLPIGEPVERNVPGGRSASGGFEPRGCILVVDDELTVRNLAQRTLERHGFEVCTAADGDAALEWIRSYRGELTAVLLDQSMPKLSGAEVLRSLDETAPDLPVVLCSGYVANRSILGSRRPAVFLQKPFLAGQLIDAVERARRGATGASFGDTAASERAQPVE